MLDVVPPVEPRLDSADAALPGAGAHPPIPPRSFAALQRTLSAVDIAFLLPLVILIGFMFVMSRSAKKKQQDAMRMRDQMQPGTGIRTIGGMYARVKEVGDDTVLLEVAPGVHAHYAKNAVGAVLEDAEYDRLVHGVEPDDDAPVVPDDASSLTGSEASAGATRDDKIGLSKESGPDRASDEDGEPKDDTGRDGDGRK
jgi:preprotein translocase subunit YajC